MDNDTFRQVIESGDVEELRSALKTNADLANQPITWFLNQENKSDPLHYVSDCVFNGLLSQEKALEIARLLLEAGAKVNGSEGRETPLIAAASLGTSDVASLLIDSGADLEATSVFGSRALHWAAAVGMPEAVKKLIEHGADIEAKCTEFGATPLFWAVHATGPDGPNKGQDPVGAARVLIAAGAEVNSSNKAGISALAYARDSGSKEMYELLSNRE